MDSDEPLIVITNSREILVPESESVEGINRNKRHRSASSSVYADTKTKQRECTYLTKIGHPSTKSLTGMQTPSTESLLSVSDIDDPFPRRFSDEVLSSLSSRTRQEETRATIARRRSISLNSVVKQRSGESAQAPRVENGCIKRSRN